MEESVLGRRRALKKHRIFTHGVYRLDIGSSSPLRCLKVSLPGRRGERGRRARSRYQGQESHAYTLSTILTKKIFYVYYLALVGNPKLFTPS